MRITRTALAAAAGATLVCGFGAEAAVKPKPVCNLVTDPANDTFLLRNQETVPGAIGAPGVYGPQEDALDIVSADLASDAKYVTAVIRVKKLATTIATGNAQGYELQFTNDGDNTLYFGARIAGATSSFTMGYRDAITNTATGLSAPSGIVDLKKSEIRITGRVSEFAGQGSGLKPGKKITMGEVTASRNVAVANVFADVAVGEKTYTMGNPSCVKPNK